MLQNSNEDVVGAFKSILRTPFFDISTMTLAGPGSFDNWAENIFANVISNGNPFISPLPVVA